MTICLRVTLLWCLFLSPLVIDSFLFGQQQQQQQCGQQQQRCLSPFGAATTALFGKTSTAKSRMSKRWYQGVEEDIEEKCMAVTAALIANRLSSGGGSSTETTTTKAYELAKGRFQDLTMTNDGSHVLESLFLDESSLLGDSTTTALEDDNNVIYGSIYILQSLCVMGMLVGVKGSPEQAQRRVQHLFNDNWAPKDNIKAMKIPQLKFLSDQTAGTQLLAALGLKRTTQGAMDLLLALGVWTTHEDLSLLRSGFPVSFTPTQLQAAEEASSANAAAVDVDDLLGIRKDMTHHKVYTIDSESTSEVDDGLSIEELDGGKRHKFWIHIADADRWAPRDSNVFEIAKARTTTHYLPTGPVPMFPPSLSMGVMSLRPNVDTCALSLGVEINDDGSINIDSLEVTQSKIKINYRLSYDDVDDMLMEGVGYAEEWQLGALMTAATKRRSYRIRNGSTEGMIPQSIPQSWVSTHEDDKEPDGIGIKVSVDASHNSGRNQTSEISSSGGEVNSVSDSNLLVTEMMILAGEALGKWKLRLDTEPATFCGRLENTLALPFRSQPKPEFWAREKEYKMLQDLLEFKHGYCHAWYARRFLSPVAIGPEPKSHFGLGIAAYVQWTSPIRRFGDLQVHAAVKRFLRRRRVHDLLFSGKEIPQGLAQVDLGCPVPVDGVADDDASTVDADIDFTWGKSLVPASKAVNRQSQQYWLYEYLNRQLQNGTPPIFEGIVLGCVDPERLQYAVYLPEIGCEHRYLSQKGFLNPGEVLKLQVVSVIPRMNLMTLALINIG